MFFWKKNKINKKFLGAKTVDVPKTAQKTIPFQEAYENGLFLNYDGSYSLIFSFENIDYSLYRDEEKQEIYKKYTQLINTIPTDIHFQEFLMNTDIDTETLTETLLSASYDYPEISDDYNSIMNGVISGSTSLGAKKIMLMAMSYKPKGNIDNANVLFKYYYVTPAYFRFNKQDIEIGDQLTRVLFIKEYSTYVDDEMINDLTDNSEKNNGQQAYQQNKQSGRNGNAPQENICSGADYSEAYGAEP